MPKSTNHSDINDVQIVKTGTPVNYCIAIFLIPSFVLFFLTLAVIGRFTIWDSLFCIIIFGGSLYSYFGRYPAKIRLYRNRLEVRYFFPWNKNIVFLFDKLITVDHKEIPMLHKQTRWFRGYQWLYLGNENDQGCQIRYHINASADERLIAELRNLQLGREILLG